MSRILWLMFLLMIPWQGHAAFMKVADIHKTEIRKVVVSPVDDRLMYVTSQNSLFRSTDRGQTWEETFVVSNEAIRDMVVDRRLYDTLYLLGEYSLYLIKGTQARKIFTVEPQNQMRCVAQGGGKVFLGTDNGLYVAGEDIWQWSKLPGFLQNITVYSIDHCGRNLYVAASDGIYRLSEGLRVEKSSAVSENLSPDQPQEGSEYAFIPRVVRCDIENNDVIYVGTTRGLLVSRDRGRTFRKESIAGVDQAEIRCVSRSRHSRTELYLATDRGLILVDVKTGQSRRLFEGLSTEDLFWLDFDRDGKLFVATARGLFHKAEFTPSEYTARMQKLLRCEPSYRVVQQEALQYNNVHPDKAKRWRQAVKYRALFPEISVDYDKTIYGTYSNGGQFAVGPRDWGLNFSWDVADLIWNTYEDDIDTRSRLNTQLRNNILDDINTVYFARLRIKAELQDSALDPSQRTEKELRLMELTAILDGYTGGAFSKRAKQLQDQN